MEKNIFTIPFGILPYIVFLNQKLEKLILGAMIHEITNRLDQVNPHAILIHFNAFILVFHGQFLFLCHPKKGDFGPHKKLVDFHI